MRLKDYIREINTNNAIRYTLWGITIVILAVLIVRFQIYKQSKIYYNKGVDTMKEEEYEEAEKYFQAALWEKHTGSQDCKIRINQALAIVKPIDPDFVDADNLDETIRRLEEAIDILCDNDCAHRDDSNGHNKKAQKLKEEIEEFIERLKEKVEKEEEEKKKQEEQQQQQQQQQQNQGGDQNNDPQSGQDQQNQNGEDGDQQNQPQNGEDDPASAAQKKEDEIREQIGQAQEQGTEERNQDLDESGQSGGYNYEDQPW